MRKMLISLLLIITMMVSCICPTVFAAGDDVEKMENAIHVVTDSISEVQQVFPDRETVSTITSIFNDFVSVARTTGSIFSVINGSVTFLKLIGLVKDNNAEALANIQTQLQIINEQLETTEKQLNNITTQMSQIQASEEFDTRTEKAIMYQNKWNDFDYRYVEDGMEDLMTQYNGMLLNGMQNWCLNRTEDARTKDGTDNSKIILHYELTDGEYKLIYTSENEVPSDFAATDRYLVLSTDFLPSKQAWNVNSYRTSIEDFIAEKIRETDDYDAFECGNFPAFTETGANDLTDELIRQVAEDAVNVLIYRVAATEVNKDSTFSLQVERQFGNYCEHLLTTEEGMDAVFQAFFLTHAFEYQIADALTLFCNEMAIKTGIYGSFAANILGMSSFITDKQKSDMLDCYCDTLIAIGEMKDNCLTGSDGFCYLTNTELYLGEISFTNRLAVNTRELSTRKAFESMSASPVEITFSGDWRADAAPTLMGDAKALLLTYMQQSNGETTEFDHLKEVLGSSVNDYGAIVTSINGEKALPLNSTLNMDVTNVIGSYFRNVSTTSLNNLPSKADSDYIKYRSMISGSIVDAEGGLEVNKVLDAAAIYAEDHWYWEVDEAAVMGGAEYPGEISKSVNKIETDLEFPGTHYYRTDYTQSVAYNCLVSVPSRMRFENKQYSPLDSYIKICKEISKANSENPIIPGELGSGSAGVIENSFVDVPEDAYYYDAVQWAAENGITEGTDATHFSPDASCSRAQMVSFLWRAAGEPTPKENSCVFTDVDLNDYYGQALLWAVEKEITKGTSDTTFSPDAIVSRGQMITFLYRFAKAEAVNSTLSFEDVAIDSYYYDAVAWAFENKLAMGTTNNTFSPDADCTRAQAVTFLNRWMVR